MIIDEGQWIARYSERDIFWLVDGEKSPHPMCMGDHWGGIFMPRSLCSHAQTLEDTVENLVAALVSQMGDLKDVGRVIGLQPYGSIIAKKLAERIGIERHRLCSWTAVKAEHKRGGWEMTYKGVSPRHGEKVLLVNDEMALGEPFLELLRSVEEGRGSLLHYMCQPFNATGSQFVPEASQRLQIVSLVDYNLRRYRPNDCELCRSGSNVLNFDDPTQWERNWAQRLIAS